MLCRKLEVVKLCKIRLPEREGRQDAKAAIDMKIASCLTWNVF